MVNEENVSRILGTYQQRIVFLKFRPEGLGTSDLDEIFEKID